MKVLITHELFFPDSAGGGEVVVYDLARGLKERGVKVKVLTTGDPNVKSYKGIKTMRIPINRYGMNFMVHRIYQEAKDVDLIQTNNYNAALPSLIAGRLLKKPVVCLVHGAYGDEWIEMRGTVLGSISQAIEALQIGHEYDKAIFLSEHGRKNAIKIGVPARVTEVIKPGVDFKKFKMKKKEPFVLFVGRISKQKGIDYLMDAARELPDVRFVVVGRDEEGGRVQEEAPENVEFKGFISQKELIDIYSRAMVFVLPSIGETFGIVQLEAMASGCAIVSTIPLDYKGITVKPRNVTQLKHAIRKLMSQPARTIQMGKQNREIAKTYDWEKFFKRLIEMYQELISKYEK